MTVMVLSPCAAGQRHQHPNSPDECNDNEKDDNETEKAVNEFDFTRIDSEQIPQ
jgi:hypothetical protein